MANNNSFKITEDTQVDLPIRGALMSMERRDWNRVKRYVKLIDDSYNRWENAAWFCAAATLSLIITGFTVLDYKKNFFIWSGFFLLAAAFLFLISYRTSGRANKSKDEVLLEMKEIEDNIPSKEISIVANQNNFEVLHAIYGTDDRNKDVTLKLNNMIYEGRLDTKASNEIDGDPHIGVIKYLKIKYRYQNRENEKEFKEGDTVSLP